MTQHDLIEDFLRQKRFAFVGLSTNPADFSHAVFKEMRERGYELVPVNPKATELEGAAAYARVQDIAGEVDGALVMTAPEQAEQVVRDCVEAGISRVWLHRGVGKGSVSESAVALCKENDIAVVEGQCPLMFIKDASWFHRLHALGKKITGTYPT